MSIKKLYYYLFYKFYKVSEASPSRWMSEWKASLALDMLVFFFIYSFFIYYAAFANNYIGGENKTILILGIIILIPNYFIFHSEDKWKDIVYQFDKLPKRKNIMGNWIVLSAVLLIIGNLIFSFYCLDQQARKNQTGPYSKEYIQQQRIKDSLDNERYKKEMQDIRDNVRN